MPLCRGGRSNLYGSAGEPILVDELTSTGHASNQYWSAREAVLLTIGDQYWSAHQPVLVAPPLLRVRCEEYVYEGIVRGTLRGAFGRRDDGISLKGKGRVEGGAISSAP